MNVDYGNAGLIVEPEPLGAGVTARLSTHVRPNGGPTTAQAVQPSEPFEVLRLGVVSLRSDTYIRPNGGPTTAQAVQPFEPFEVLRLGVVTATASTYTV